MTPLETIKYFAYDIPELVKMYHYSGDFEGEINAIDLFLSRNTVPKALKERLCLQRLTAEVLQNDYELTDDDFLKILNERQDKKVLTLNDINDIASFQNADYILVSGKRKWPYSQTTNVLCQHPDFFEKTEPSTNFDNTITDNMAKNGGMTVKFVCRETCSIKEHAVKTGETLRIWLPYPVACETQDGSKIKLLKASHPCKITGDRLRMAFIETEAKQDDEFFIEFEYENKAKYFSPDAVIKSKIKDYSNFEDYDKYTKEECPQTVFTPFLKGLALEITKGLESPGEKAFAIYSYITANIQYSYLRDYLIIPNIPEFVAINGYGDCGAMVLLFIVLCRICGIPAKWQSGSGVTIDRMGSHDWCMFYLPEFGWLYCDPSYGAHAYRTGNSSRHMHYFCNIDAHRMVAANDFLVELTPVKKCMRMDPYDNQSGEAEYKDGSMNIFYNDWSFSKKCLSAENLSKQ